MDVFKLIQSTEINKMSEHILITKLDTFQYFANFVLSNISSIFFNLVVLKQISDSMPPYL